MSIPSGQINLAHNSMIWSQEEENFIKKMIEVSKIKNWSQIAELLSKETGKNTYTGKQCRERYINFIKFGRKEELLIWTHEQEKKLFELYREFGSKWVKMVDFFEFKSENSLKNKFYGSIRKMIRKLNIVGKEYVGLKKPIKYESVLKPLEFGLEQYSARYGEKEYLAELKEMIIKFSVEELPEHIHYEFAADLIHKINQFNLRTRSARVKKSSGKMKLNNLEHKKSETECGSDSLAQARAKIQEGQNIQSEVKNERQIEKINQKSVGYQETPIQHFLIDYTFFEIQVEASKMQELCSPSDREVFLFFSGSEQAL